MIPTLITGIRPTISIWLDSLSDTKMKQFHCLVCGKIVFEYYNAVRMVLPGEPEYRKSPVIVQCHGMIEVYDEHKVRRSRCKTRYYIA